MLCFIVTLVLSLIFTCYILISGDTNMYDFAIIGTALTTTAGLAGATQKYYYNKAGLENVNKIRIGSYKEIMDIRLQYDKEILNIQREFGVSQEDIMMMESNTIFANASDEMINNVNNKLNQSAEDNSSDITD